MTTIQYLVGDATQPEGSGLRIISHICNDSGRWGKGFVVALSKRWPQPEAAYRDWFAEREEEEFALGNIQCVRIESDLFVCNMIAQHGVKPKDGVQPIRYDAVETCLSRLADMVAKYLTHASIHMPRIGCGLAGGDWRKIEPIIRRTLCAKDVPVYVYDPPDKGGSA